MADLDPIQQTAAKALSRHWNSHHADGISRLGPDEFACDAADVVAALRPVLYEEAAQRMLQHATEAENKDATEGAVYTFAVAADQLRQWGKESGDRG